MKRNTEIINLILIQLEKPSHEVAPTNFSNIFLM